jgi:hypothetical protein
MEEIPMKPLVLAVAVAVLATGCYGRDRDAPLGSVNLYWAFVRNAPAQPTGVIVYDDADVGSGNGPCAESGVELVTVDSPLGQVSVPCVFGGVEGVAIDRIPAGNRVFRVRGWRGAFVVYDRTFTLRVAGDAITDHFLDVTGVSARLEAYADLYNATVGQFYPDCAAAAPAGSPFPPDIRIEIRDVFGNLVDTFLAACGFALPALVFADHLDLDNYTVRMFGLRRGDSALVFDSCSAPLDHFAPGLGLAGGFRQTLVTPLPACP